MIGSEPPAWLTDVADALTVRIPELRALVQRHLRDDVPDFWVGDDPALATAESERITIALQSMIDGLRGASGLSPSAIDKAVAEARLAAQAGLDLMALIRTYRVAQSVIWDVLMAETTRVIDEPDQQLTALRYVSQFQFGWNDVIVAKVISGYEDERRSGVVRARDRRLRAALKDLLDGTTDQPPPIDYPFAVHHLAAVLWGDAEMTGFVDSLAAACGAEHRLDLAGSSGTIFAWLALTDRDASVRELRTRLAPPTGVHVAFGNPLPGGAGFRRSHLQAWRAYGVGRWTDAPVVWYSDVALESLYLRDLQAARDLVVQQLGPLDLGDPRTEVLCSTMRAYFLSGCNASRAAAMLGVHERTISYRLRSIESKLGADVATRRDELGVALRLLEVVRTISNSASLAGPGRPKPDDLSPS